MREIRFRAWHTQTEEMIDDPYDGEYLSETTSLNSVIRGCHKDEHQILMQYTGLKDKNGVEIYEGDIVRSMSNFYNGVEHEMTNSVLWLDDSAQFSLNGWGDRKISDFYSIEVIGNIWENPELLEQSQ